MKTARDTWLIFGRYLGILLANPVWVMIEVIQPVLYLLLFAPLLTSIASVRGFPPGGAYNVFVPGLLIQLSLLGSAGVGFSLIAELRAGVIERLRVTPVSRFALMFGRLLRDVVTLLVQAAILLVLAVPFGLSVTIAGVALMFVLVALVGFTVGCLAYVLALLLRNEDSYSPLVFTASVPLLLLSGVLLPLTLAPDWLRAIAAFDPLAYAVNAARDLFNGQMGSPDVLFGTGLMAVLALAAIALAARAFNRAVA